MLCFVLPSSAMASGLSFSITPTIFDMAAVPGQSWETSLKVVNNNPYELTVYASAVNFVPQGERGHGSFLPVTPTEMTGTTLAEWMNVTNEPIVIAKESSVSVPVQVTVPQAAAPGGHYAAIMIATNPPENDGSSKIRTSQIIASLFFVRIAGDVIEHGEVRTFRPTSAFAGSPEMSFEMRFENKGNVHLLPRGEIVITNMWGKQRGVIPINQESNFGNVLPESIRQFDFTWKGEASLLDIGRYEANLTLGYGVEEKKFTTRGTSFWVVPIKPVLIFLGSALFCIVFVTWSVRAYVRYMLRLSGIDPSAPVRPSGQPRYILGEGDVRIERPVSVAAPVRAGVSDLRSRLAGVHAFWDSLKVLAGFVFAYKRFFATTLGFILLFFVVWWYVANVTVSDRDFEVTIEAGATPVTLSSEEILHERDAVLPPAVESPATTSPEQAFAITIVNAGNTPGEGGVLADQLTAAGYTVGDISADLETERETSVIVYDPALEATALKLSDMMGGVLLSAFTDETKAPSITIYIGNDYTPE